jgi:hypothetical protein
VWWKARRWAKAADTKWRRRVGTIFFLAPFLVTLAKVLPLPEVTRVPIELLGKLREVVDAMLKSLTGLAAENLSGFWLAAARMLLSALVYGGVGVLIGWPLDKLFSPTAKQAEELEKKGQT